MEHEEIQRCPRALILTLVIATALSAVLILLASFLLAYDARVGNEEVWIPAVIVVVTIACLGLLFHFSRLLVRIDADGVFVRFSPFHMKGRLLGWDEITSITIRSVSPFTEFGGWGIRWNLGNRIGYVWNGQYGIELHLTDGKIVVITINDLDGARLALNTFVTAGNTKVTIQDRSIT